MPKEERTNAFKLHRVSCHRDVGELRPTAATGVYRSVVVSSPICKSPKSPARNTSCLKHTTAPQRKRQASPGHDCSAPSKRPCRCSISHKSDPADPQPRVTTPRVDTIVTQQSQENILLTSPTAIATFPLLAPETTTGVYRSVLVPSPTCAERYHHQPNTHIPHDTQRAP